MSQELPKKIPQNLELSLINSRVGLSGVNKETIRLLAIKYAHIFSLPPWNEIHHVDEVKNRLAADMAKDDSVMIILSDTDGPQGFIWGFGGEPQDIVSHMITTWFEGLSQDQCNQLVQTVATNLSNAKFDGLPSSYISELAVDPTYQGLKTSAILMMRMCEEQGKLGKKIYIATTKKGSTIYRMVVRHLGGIEVCDVGAIADGENWTILAGEFEKAAQQLKRYV